MAVNGSKDRSLKFVKDKESNQKYINLEYEELVAHFRSN